MGENIIEKDAKLIMRNILVGIISFMGLIGSSAIIAFAFQTNLTGNLTDLGTAIRTMNGIGIVWGIVSFVEIAGMVILSAWIAPMIGKILRLQNKDEPKIELPKRIKITGLFLFGIIGSLFIYGMVAFIQGISPNTTITDLGSLKTAIMTGNIIMLLGLLGVMAAFGTMWIWFGKNYHRFQDKLPNKAP